jgi:acetyl-CoA carboxylase biotin carboxyl carrier protein
VAIIEITTDITGTVWKVLKQVGDTVEEDEPILVLESMKMEIPVAAPEYGVIREIVVKEGETAPEGSVVARIEA